MTARALPIDMIFEDRQTLNYLAMSVAMHVLFLLLVMSMPDTPLGLELDGFSAQDRFVQLLLQPEQEIEEPAPQWLAETSTPAAGHVGEEGQAGKETSVAEDKHMAVKGPPDRVDPMLQKKRDIDIAMHAGAMALFNDQALSSPWATSDQSIGADAMDAIGQMQGAEPGEGTGIGGIGISGTGRRGPGDSETGFGLARVGTKAPGGGGRPPEPEFDPRPTRTPEVTLGTDIHTTGSLDREIIQRVVRQNRRDVRYCYEQELQRHRDLAGRVVIRFTIASTGAVISAVVGESSMNNANVERCMTERIRRWAFPEPRGGGVVIVTYPFNFSS